MCTWQAGLGANWPGLARPGVAWQARGGTARRGMTEHGQAWQGNQSFV